MLSIVCAGLSGVDSAMLYLSCGEDDSHRAFGIYESLGQLGLILSAGIYAFCAGENYRLAALLTVFSYGAAAVLSLGLREVIPVSAKVPERTLRKIKSVIRSQLSNPGLLLLLPAMALFNETHQTVTVFLSQLQYVRAGMSHWEISLAYILVNVAALAGGLSAKLSDRFGMKTVGVTLMALAAVSCLALGLFPVPLISVLAVTVLRGCFGLMQPLQMQLQNRMITAGDRATALSVNAVVMEAIGIFLNLIFGSVAQARLDLALYLAAALCGIGAVLCRRAFRKMK